VKGLKEAECRANLALNFLLVTIKSEERADLGRLVPCIGDTIDVENFGEYYDWYGDCLHWMQPGIPDLYAGELKTFSFLPLLATCEKGLVSASIIVK